MPDLLHQTCSGNKTRKQMGNNLVLFPKKNIFHWLLFSPQNQITAGIATWHFCQ